MGLRFFCYKPQQHICKRPNWMAVDFFMTSSFLRWCFSSHRFETARIGFSWVRCSEFKLPPLATNTLAVVLLSIDSFTFCLDQQSTEIDTSNSISKWTFNEMLFPTQFTRAHTHNAQSWMLIWIMSIIFFCFSNLNGWGTHKNIIQIVVSWRNFLNRHHFKRLKRFQWSP